MEWRLSDGTTVVSDGRAITVTGTSEFAEYLAYRATTDVEAPEYPPPGGWVALTPSRARNVDAWLRFEIRIEGGPVMIVSAPEIEPLPTPEPEYSDPPAVY